MNLRKRGCSGVRMVHIWISSATNPYQFAALGYRRISEQFIRVILRLVCGL